MKSRLRSLKPLPSWKKQQVARVVEGAGVAVNLSWGMLSAWSPGSKALINTAKVGQVIAEGPARS